MAQLCASTPAGRLTRYTRLNKRNRKKEADMSEVPTVPPIVNRTMKFVLRSPLHGIVDKKILLIAFIGRKSGKTYTTPVVILDPAVR